MNYFKKHSSRVSSFMIALVLTGITGCLTSCNNRSPYTVKHSGDRQSLVQVNKQEKYLLLPVEDSADESRIEVTVNNNVVQTINVRLAVNKTEYYVPLDLSAYDATPVVLKVNPIDSSAVCWTDMKLSDTFEARHETFRPAYHFAPLNGWMNDPNGMVYKDGEYHLYYQHNPYGSTWGNLSWGHAVSRDLVNWEHLPDAIVPDELGLIFSGSAVVDKDNTAGFGAGAIVAIYTSAGERQTQSIAYSLDNGRTFTKYEGNPVLTSEVPDFRDPKVIWHEQTRKWIMVLAVGQEMQIYSSSDLKAWQMESRFGEGQGAHGGVWECPDLIELAVDGTDQKKWVLICNLNPGGPFGGSAAQYFVGTFDGKTFVNESPSLTKWMDWGKDHYAAVTWSNAPDNRHIAIAWMSNWQYANQVPTKQFRSSNSVPRDLSLYTSNGETYMQCKPSPELLALRGELKEEASFKVDRNHNLNDLLAGNNGSYEIEMTIENRDAEIIGFQLFNSKGEEVYCYYNLVEHKFYMDRSRSGIVDFSAEFPAVTAAPIEKTKEFKLRLFVDKSSIEAFGQDGRFAMTNLVFPAEPYDRISFYSKGGTYTVTSLKMYQLTPKQQ